MATHLPDERDGAPEPTTAQLARARSLRRFNWAFVYLPLLLGGLVALGLIGTLIWSAVASQRFGALEGPQARQFVSGMADTFFVLAAAPLALVCTALPLLFFAGIISGRRRGMAPWRRLQQLIWRLDRLLVTGDDQVQRQLPRVAGFVIRTHAGYCRLNATARRLAGQGDAPKSGNPPPPDEHG